MSSEVRSLARRFVQLSSASFINTAVWLDRANVGCWEWSMWAACRESMKETKTGRDRNRQVNPEAGRLAAEKRDRGFVKTTADDTYCMLLNENENDHLKLFFKNKYLQLWRLQWCYLFWVCICSQTNNLFKSDLQGRLCLPAAADFSVLKPSTPTACQEEVKLIYFLPASLDLTVRLKEAIIPTKYLICCSWYLNHLTICVCIY